MPLDWTILHYIRDTLACAPLDLAMPAITRLGNAGAVWLLAAALLLCSKRFRRQGLLLLLGLALGYLLGNLALKPLVARARPCWLDPTVPLLIPVPRDYSFPSGHTLASAIGATMLTLTDRRLAWAAIPLAALIAFSRLYLYVHFPSDVLAGALLGLAIGQAAFRGGTAALERLAPRREG